MQETRETIRIQEAFTTAFMVKIYSKYYFFVVILFILNLATKRIIKRGDGSASVSCMSCDPALPTCSIGCQTMIDYMYKVCDRICLPDGYYYDSGIRGEICRKLI